MLKKLFSVHYIPLRNLQAIISRLLNRANTLRRAAQCDSLRLDTFRDVFKWAHSREIKRGCDAWTLIRMCDEDGILFASNARGTEYNRRRELRAVGATPRCRFDKQRNLNKCDRRRVISDSAYVGHVCKRGAYVQTTETPGWVRRNAV